ncbi:hypothetical protein DH2020_001945 [Rehmannia glutinosa]|uniref:Uncharacterized protein n=1 Tax=Rehmannia glutinosa TaxID=99300 RepID=A0ABR0XT13_REHGL
MPALSDKELEQRLTAAGKSLLQPPPSPDELLPLLDKIEELLSKVEQSPAKSMQASLSPLMKALVVEDLVKHSDVDVKVGVASCISEITRITAPDAPYDDDKMKDVFQMIVSSFENLSDTSSRSYEKRATILETVAKVRSCVIMLDLECDQMIIEMFQHFLKAIRGYHAEVIFASMETIMTLAVMPIAKKLAERVIQNSADKLKPYLAQAVKSLDASVDDYGEVVASVCRETGTVGHSNESISKDQPVVERKSASASPARDPVTQARCSNDLVIENLGYHIGGEDDIEESNLQEKDPSLIGSSKSIMSNGINETGTEEIMAHANSSKKADSNHHVDAKSMSKTESDDCGAQNPVVLEAEAGHSEAQRVADNHETPGKDVHISPTEVKPVEAVTSLDKVEDTTTQLSPSEASENEAANVASPTQSGSLCDESRSKKDSLAKREENLVREEIASADIASKKASEGKNISKAKKQRHTSDSEARSLDQIEKLADASNKTEAESSISKEDGKQRGRVKPKFEKDSLKSSTKEVHAKDTVTSPRSPLKSMKDDGIQEETPRMSTKRKCTPGTEKASDTIEYGKNLVGSKVKVWWPKDRMFYEGVISSFNSAHKKHKVEYTDGEVEVLNLKKERWEFVGDDLVSDGDDDVEHSSHGTSSEVQRKKKGNAKSETSSKRQKMDSAPKRMTKTSSSKVKESDRKKEKLADLIKSSETAKGKPTDTAKSRESGSKSGKKRRR